MLNQIKPLIEELELNLIEYKDTPIMDKWIDFVSELEIQEDYAN